MVEIVWSMRDGRLWIEGDLTVTVFSRAPPRPRPYRVRTGESHLDVRPTSAERAPGRRNHCRRRRGGGAPGDIGRILCCHQGVDDPTGDRRRAGRLAGAICHREQILSRQSPELARSPGYTALAQIGYADTPGFEAKTGDTTQTTGPGRVLGLDPGYRAAFPAGIRVLIGQGSVLLAQQTAANLHATPGSVITIQRPGLDPVQVTVDGIVDLPQADSLFQSIGAPPGAAPQAPPDNVLLLPLDQWHALFDGVTAVSPDAVRIQLHATIPHDLPSDPAAAYVDATGMTRNYEARLAGNGVVGDNLAARLDVARSDALYAQMLFLFLGFPGVILASILTAVLVATGSVARRREQALLRLRGASAAQVVRLAAAEAMVIGICGSALGLASR